MARFSKCVILYKKKKKMKISCFNFSLKTDTVYPKEPNFTGYELNHGQKIPAWHERGVALVFLLLIMVLQLLLQQPLLQHQQQPPPPHLPKAAAATTPLPERDCFSCLFFFFFPASCPGRRRCCPLQSVFCKVKWFRVSHAAASCLQCSSPYT